MNAATFNCPSCGAAISKDSTQCQYCRSLLQTVACPSCFGLMFLGSKFCPHCGARGEATRGATDGRAHACPRCKVGLGPVAVGGTQLEECGRCGGLWVGADTFERICADRETQTVAIGLDLPPPVATDDRVRYLKCPQCSQLMGRKKYAHGAGVIIDICKSHGIWFDRDELRRIIEFIRAGGLDRARVLEKEELERQRQRLEAERRMPSSPDSLLSGVYNDRIGGDATLLGVGTVLSWLLG